MNNRETARNNASGHQILAIRKTMASIASASVRQTSSTARLSRLPAGTAVLVATAVAVTGLRMLTPTALYRDSKGPGFTGAFEDFAQQPLTSASC
jgi:hypothetical protein